MNSRLGPFKRSVAAFLICVLATNSFANPKGMGVGSGSASAQANGSTLTITTSQSAILNWQSFNIAQGETTIFNQPSVNSIVINNIHDANASQIYGSLQANGMVVLMNPSGFYFGPNSFIKTGGLIVSTAANMAPPQNGGGSWEFNGPPPLANIINYGKIEVGKHGSVFLIADGIENHGTITAPGGTIGLASGQTVLLSERPDGRGLSMEVTLPRGSVDNYGKLLADSGTISLQAKVVNQDGFIQANSVRNENGAIELVASDELNLGSSSQITANGDDSDTGSAGGSVTLKSGNNFNDSIGSRISAAGGSQGGNGGSVEISAPNILSLNSHMDASAQAGSSAGKLFLDPDYINLNSFGSDSAGSGTVLVGDSPGSTLNLNVNSAFTGFSQILLQAKYDITLADGTSWNLSTTTGNSSGQLTLEAGRNIIVGDGASLIDANNWSMNFYAGVTDFAPPTPTVTPGVGSILLNQFNGGFQQNSFIQTGSGSINLVAGQNITVGAGAITTTAGGDINAHALAGNIDTGNFAQGYHFRAVSPSLSQAYTLSGGLGGISTAAGGNVTLIAGGNVSSVLPTKGGYFYDGNFYTPNNGTDYTTAGSGAYGRTQDGDVTIVAGGDVTGHYLVANGNGSIAAGVKMDANGNPITDGFGHYVHGPNGSAGTDVSNPNFALSLISGGWDVSASKNIILQEVRNPNGVFDISGGAALNHLFDYSANSYLNLTAGNLIQLGASSSSLPRGTGIGIPTIYPSTLNITADPAALGLASGAGNVVLGTSGSSDSLILFPSMQGSLTINTKGSLTANLNPLQGAPQLFNLIVSDSGLNQYKTTGNFGINDHAATPIHENNPTPITLNIGGDMNYIFLSVPEAAQITVGGNMNNCRFQGMNLAANDVTSIHVTGDINNASGFTTIDLNTIPGSLPPDLSVLARAVTDPGQPSAVTLSTSFFYNPDTGVLTYKTIPGVNLAGVLALLQNLNVQQYAKGVPQWADPPDDTVPILEPNPAHVLNAATAAALFTQYNIAGGVPNNASSSGYVLGGGGTFDISGHNIDLGATIGIQSKGVGLYRVGANFPLANLFGDGGVFDHGADIDVTTTGNLTMFSSSIASVNGGDISVNAAGTVSVGSSEFSVNTLGARGIYSTSGGDVSVIGGGNINVNGSRIATYDGGNITVESKNGDINAGSGTSLPVSVQAFYEDPATHIVYQSTPQIPFSGITALTFPERDDTYPAPPATLGNILVEAPNGNVNANVSGILQIPLNHLNYPDAVTAVLAGYELRDTLGNPVDASHMDGATAVQTANDGDINANGSGIIASNAKLDAAGDINGLIFARNNIDINAQQSVNVTALGVGNVSVSGNSISGTIVGVGGISVSGASIDASLISGNVSGATSGSTGLGQGDAAGATSQSASGNSDEETKKIASTTATDDSEDKKKRGTGNGPTIVRRTGRVTVILPQAQG